MPVPDARIAISPVPEFSIRQLQAILLKMGMTINQKAKRKIIPVASGKGGAGKSMITANLGLRLGTAGIRTVVVDMDLGGSNLHTYLGYRNKHKGLGNLLSDTKTGMRDIMVQTHIPDLRFVPGDVLVTGLSSPTPAVRKKLVSAIEGIEADIVLIDLGSGTTPLVVEMFLLSNSGLVVATPEAPSVLNAYSLLKNVLFRRLQEEFTTSKRISAYLKDVQKDKTPGSTPTLRDIADGIQKIDKKSGNRARKAIAQLKPHLVMNMLTQADDFRIAESLRDLVDRNLGIALESLGAVFHDPSCSLAVRALRPLTEFAPESVASTQIDRMAQKIAQSENFPDMPLDLDEYESSYGLTALEVSMDAEAFSGDTGASVTGEARDEEYLEVISQQKREIDQLKGTIRTLTAGSDSPF